MRVRGDVQPSNAFTVEEQPKKPGFCLVRFFENPQEFSEEQGELTVSGWEYDEYHLEMADTGSLEEDVLNNYDALLEQAKAAEAEAEGGGSDDLEERVAAMETGKADKDEVQAVWDQMAAAYSEGVQEA
jgi:hypothetical protein